MSVIEKMVDEGLASYMAVIDTLKKFRGADRIDVTSASHYVETTMRMKPVENQSPEVFALHRNSVRTHYEILKELAKEVDVGFRLKINATPVILEGLYEIDEKLKEAVGKFAETVDKADDLIGKEAMWEYCGFYGPRVINDFAPVPGSTVRILKILLDLTEIDSRYKDVILASRSWGGASYSFGGAFRSAVNAGKKLDEALKEEKEALKLAWMKPTETLRTAPLNSSYIERYRKGMKTIVEAAVNAGVHYGNIVTMSYYALDDVGEHISGRYARVLKDDMVMAILEAIAEVAENTLRKGVRDGKFRSEWQVLRAATGSTAAAVAHILELDCFTSSMVIDLFSKWWPNVILTRGYSWGHFVDFLEMLARGERIIEKRPIGSGGKVGEAIVDLSPIEKNETIMNLGRETVGCAGFTRFSSLLRLADVACIITPEPLSVPLLTNITALHKEKAIAPWWHCKSCATTRYWKRHMYCYTEKS